MKKLLLKGERRTLTHHNSKPLDGVLSYKLQVQARFHCNELQRITESLDWIEFCFLNNII